MKLLWRTKGLKNQLWISEQRQRDLTQWKSALQKCNVAYKHPFLPRMEGLYCRTKMMHHVSLFMIHPCVCIWMEWGGWRVYWVFIKLKGSIVAAETRWEGLSWLLMMREISSIHHFTWRRHVSHVWQCSKWRLLTTEIGTIILYTRSSLMDKQYQVWTTWSS